MEELVLRAFFKSASEKVVLKIQASCEKCSNMLRKLLLRATRVINNVYKNVFAIRQRLFIKSKNLRLRSLEYSITGPFSRCRLPFIHHSLVPSYHSTAGSFSRCI